MKKIFSIAKWEFFQRVKNRSFIISLILTPLLIFSIGLAAGFTERETTPYSKIVGIAETDGKTFQLIGSEIEKERLPDGQPNFIAIKINKNELNNNPGSLIKNNFAAALIIPGGTSPAAYNIITNYEISPYEIELLKKALNRAVTKAKLLQNPAINYKDLNPLDGIIINHEFAEDELGGIENFSSFFFKSFLFVFLLIAVIIFSGSSFVRSLIEEKTTRIIELLLSSCSAGQLLAGKLIGLTSLGLFQIIFWFLIGSFFYEAKLLAFISIENLGLQIVYFLLGYFLYSSIFIGLGSLASSENEAQQVTSFLSLFLLMPVILSAQILIDPYSPISGL